MQDCLIPFREAYIAGDKLNHIVSKFPVTRKEAISKRLPRKGSVMSGDFGYFRRRVLWMEDQGDGNFYTHFRHNIFPQKSLSIRSVR